METDRICPGPDPGLLGSDREIFERVWRRVMPENLDGCPIRTLTEEEAAQRDSALSAAVSTPPADSTTVPSAPTTTTETPSTALDTQPTTAGVSLAQNTPALLSQQEVDSTYADSVPCLGSASGIYGDILQRF